MKHALFLNLLASVTTVCPNGGSSCNTGLPNVAASSSQLQAILQIVFVVLGAVAVLFVVIGGVKLTLSSGNPQEVTKAKNTIIYALAGLVIAAFAEVIVSFVLSQAP